MPYTDVKTTPTWYYAPAIHTGELTDYQYVIKALLKASPLLVAGGWNQANQRNSEWGNLDPSSVIVDSIPPFGYVTGDTPDVVLTLRPNYTEFRWSNERYLHDDFDAQVLRWLEDVHAEHPEWPCPSVIVDVNFVMGSGAWITPARLVDEVWPKK